MSVTNTIAALLRNVMQQRPSLGDVAIDESGAFGGLTSEDFGSATPGAVAGKPYIGPTAPMIPNTLPDRTSPLDKIAATATPTAPVEGSPLRSVLQVLSPNKINPTQRRRPLETLMLFLAPAGEAFANTIAAPDAQKNRAFYSSLIRGGLSSLADVATRPERLKLGRRQQDIEDILLGAKVAEAESKSRPNLQHVEGVDKEGNPALGTFNPATGTYGGVSGPKKTTEQRDRFSLQWRGDEESGQLYRVNLDTKQAEPIEIQEGQLTDSGEVKRGSTPFSRSKKNTFRITDTQTGEVMEVDQKTLEVLKRRKILTPRPDVEVQNRAEATRLEQSAQAVIEKALQELGAKATPEQVANRAVEIVNEQVKTKPALGAVAAKIRDRVREIQRRAKTPNEMRRLLQEALAGLAQENDQEQE